MMILTLFSFLCILVNVFCDIPPYLRNRQTCSGNACVLQELELEEIINSENTQACENFYEYSCASWKQETEKPNFEPFWNHFVASSYKIKHQIQNILENNDDELLKKPKMFYNACINSDKEENKYLKNLKLLIEYFREWPAAKNSWAAGDYDWLGQVVEITKMLGIHPILKFSVNIDYKNTSKYSLYIEPGNLIFPTQLLLNPEIYTSELGAYKKWILDTILHIYPRSKKRRNLKSEVSKIVDFEIKLAKLQNTGRVKIEKFVLQELSEKFDKNFFTLFWNLFSDMDVKISKTDTLIIKHYNYFKNLMAYFEHVNTKDIANYLIWVVVRELSRETTKHMRLLNFSIDKAILGVTVDLSRNTECLDKTIIYFNYAILPIYIKYNFNDSVVHEIEEITVNVKKEFIKILGNNEWLSEKTRILAMEKIENIKTMIGYPKWTENRQLLAEYYDDLKIEHDHLTNVILAKGFKMTKKLKNLHKQVTNYIWPFNIFNTNAYYSILQNTIFVPIGLLNDPFYYQCESEQPSRACYNYGRIGSLIGHEMGHALDSSGRQADQNGVMNKWWFQKDVTAYKVKTTCFESKYKYSDALNIGENIADNVGLEISYQAFQKTLELDDDLTDDKRRLFFKSYAQMWCEISDQNDLLNDEHTPVEERVNQAVYNNVHFLNTFNCKNYNISEPICKLW